MKFANPHQWNTLIVNAPAGFITYFLKMQNKLKTSFNNANLKAAQFEQVSDKMLSIKIYPVNHEGQGLDKVKKSLFNQLPDRTPAQAKDFIEVNIK